MVLVLTSPRIERMNWPCRQSCLPRFFVLFLATLERRHHVFGKPAQLFFRFRRREPLGPVNHETVEPRIFGFDRFDPGNDIGRRPAKPGLLLYTVLEGWGARGRARRTPGPALLICITHEPEWREPFEALVMAGSSRRIASSRLSAR